MTGTMTKGELRDEVIRLQKFTIETLQGHIETLEKNIAHADSTIERLEETNDELAEKIAEATMAMRE